MILSYPIFRQSKKVKQRPITKDIVGDVFGVLVVESMVKQRRNILQHPALPAVATHLVDYDFSQVRVSNPITVSVLNKMLGSSPIIQRNKAQLQLEEPGCFIMTIVKAGIYRWLWQHKYQLLTWALAFTWT